MNSRKKGAEGEREFIRLHLAQHWPEAKRNLDQFGDQKQDCLEAGGFHWQIKRTESFRLWDSIKQAEGEAYMGATPLVAFRRNHSPWYVVARAEFIVPLLAEADSGE